MADIIVNNFAEFKNEAENPANEGNRLVLAIGGNFTFTSIVDCAWNVNITSQDIDNRSELLPQVGTLLRCDIDNLTIDNVNITGVHDTTVLPPTTTAGIQIQGNCIANITNMEAKHFSVSPFKCIGNSNVDISNCYIPVSYTHLTLPTTSRV